MWRPKDHQAVSRQQGRPDAQRSAVPRRRHGAQKDMAALLTQICDAGLEAAVKGSQGNCAQVQ